MMLSSNYPKGRISEVKGQSIALNGDDIDTDRLIPARFLKCVSFENLGEQAFADDRLELNGSHPFDQIDNNAQLLIVGKNFGCGSSREHAPQALMRWGIRAIIGESFAEIFYGNCLAIGIPCATSESSTVNEIQNIIQEDQAREWLLDIRTQVLRSNEDHIWNINIEPGAREMFLTGQWDATKQLLERDEKIKKILESIPYLNNFK